MRAIVAQFCILFQRNLFQRCYERRAPLCPLALLRGKHRVLCFHRTTRGTMP